MHTENFQPTIVDQIAPFGGIIEESFKVSNFFKLETPLYRTLIVALVEIQVTNVVAFEVFDSEIPNKGPWDHIGWLWFRFSVKVSIGKRVELQLMMVDFNPIIFILVSIRSGQLNWRVINWWCWL